MLIKKISPMALMLLATGLAFGQTVDIEESTSSLVERLGPENLQYVSELPANLPTNLSNSIYIQQIGSKNHATAKIESAYSELNLTQNGNSNRAKVDLSAKTAVHNLIQNGNNNFLMEYGNSANLNLERNIIQNGNNHGVVIFGSNSLTDNIILNLQGSSKMITIRNFN